MLLHFQKIYLNVDPRLVFEGVVRNWSNDSGLDCRSPPGSTEFTMNSVLARPRKKITGHLVSKNFSPLLGSTESTRHSVLARPSQNHFMSFGSKHYLIISALAKSKADLPGHTWTYNFFSFQLKVIKVLSKTIRVL